jgi:hypothetical protein
MIALSLSTTLTSRSPHLNCGMSAVRRTTQSSAIFKARAARDRTATSKGQRSKHRRRYESINGTPFLKAELKSGEAIQ